MLQQQLQLQNPLPVDDMNMADAPVKSGFSGNDKSNSEGFEQALSQSQDHQRDTRQTNKDEPKAARTAETAAESKAAKPTDSSDKASTGEEPKATKQAPERANNDSKQAENVEHSGTEDSEAEAAKTESSQSSNQEKAVTNGQEAAASKDLEQQIKNIQNLVAELDADMDASELKAMLSDLSEALEALAPQLKQLEGKIDSNTAKLEMALTKVSEFVTQAALSDEQLTSLVEQIQLQVSQVTKELKQDLNQKTAALDKLVEDLESDNEQAQWLATIAAMVKSEKPDLNKGPESDAEIKLDAPEAKLNVQQQLNLETQTVNQAKYELNINAEQLSLKDKVVFEPLSHSLVRQIQVPNESIENGTSKTKLSSVALEKAALEQTSVDKSAVVEELPKGEKVADKQGNVNADVVLPNLLTKSGGNTTAQALAQLTANMQSADAAVQGQGKLDPQQIQMSDFSREKFLAELSSSPALMRSLQANSLNLDIETPAVKPQVVEVQGVQLDKTLVQPKLESIQNAKQEVVIRENILFNKNELAANMQTQVGLMMARNMKSVDIRLDPPELGTIQVRLSVNNDQAAVSFVVSSQQAKDALEGSMNKLKELLEQEGMNLADTDVKQENGGKEQGQEGDEQGQFAGGQMDEDGMGVDDPVLAEKIRQINSPWNVDFYA